MTGFVAAFVEVCRPFDPGKVAQRAGVLLDEDEWYPELDRPYSGFVNLGIDPFRQRVPNLHEGPLVLRQFGEIGEARIADPCPVPNVGTQETAAAIELEIEIARPFVRLEEELDATVPADRGLESRVRAAHIPVSDAVDAMDRLGIVQEPRPCIRAVVRTLGAEMGDAQFIGALPFHAVPSPVEFRSRGCSFDDVLHSNRCLRDSALCNRRAMESRESRTVVHHWSVRHARVLYSLPAGESSCLPRSGERSDRERGAAPNSSRQPPTANSSVRLPR